MTCIASCVAESLTAFQQNASAYAVYAAGLVYQALGFPPQFFTVLFAIPRVTGYLAHWRESLSDPDTKILRPQQDYRVSCNVLASVRLITRMMVVSMFWFQCFKALPHRSHSIACYA